MLHGPKSIARASSTVGCACALLWAAGSGCQQQESSSPIPTGSGGATTATSATTSSSSTGMGGSGGTSTATTSSTSTTTQTGSAGGGGLGPVESCDELSTDECFSNYDCADASRRCENVGTEDLPIACCVPGPRGQGALGAPCTNENDCVSSLCIEIDPQWVCSDQCNGDGQCEAPLPDCVTIPVLEGTFSFCSP